GKMVPAIIRLEQRTEKKDGKTRKFVVPVIDVPSLTLGKFLAGSGSSLMLGGEPPEQPRRVERPALPPAVDLPEHNQSWREPTPPIGSSESKKPNGGDAKKSATLLAQLTASLQAVRQDDEVAVDAWSQKWNSAIAQLVAADKLTLQEAMSKKRGLPF
ncbi:MAG: hypothetical protein ACREJC_17440, partial [Tepidisphaeraceae bacterium]